MFEDDPLIEYTMEDAKELANMMQGSGDFSDKRIFTRLTLFNNDPLGLIDSLVAFKRKSVLNPELHEKRKQLILYTPYDEVPMFINDCPELVRWRLQIGK